MRKSLRMSALALMAAAMLGASATSASATPGPGGEESGSPQVNICGNTNQQAEVGAEEALATGAEQENDGHHPTICQTGVGNTIYNINPDIYVNVALPENGAEDENGEENGGEENSPMDANGVLGGK